MSEFPPLASRAALALAALAFFCEGVGTQAMGLAVPAILRAWSVPRAALELPTALGLLGFAAGAVLGGGSADRLGRRTTLFLSLLFLGLFTAVCAFTHDPAQLGIVRIFAGLALGASLTVAATVMAESVPTSMRSLAMALGLAFLPLGGFAAGIGASFILPAWGWRGIFIGAGAVALSLAIIGIVILGPDATASPQPAAANVEAPHEWLQSIRRFFGREQRRDTLGLCGAFFCIVLLYYSMFSWGPTALASVGLSLPQASRALSAFALGGLVGGLVAGALVHHWGSRITLWLLSAGALASAGLLAQIARSASADSGPLVFVIAILGATVTGVQTLLFALGPQVYPRAERGSGMGLAVGIGRIGAVASSFTAVVALDIAGVRGFFGSLALAVVLALICGLLVRGQVPARAARRAAVESESAPLGPGSAGGR